MVLVVGFFIGFFTHSTIVRDKINKYSWGRGESNFWERALNEIQATPEQHDNIMDLVKEYSQKSQQVMHQTFKQVEPIWEELNEKITPLLNKEQNEKLNRLKEERSKRFKSRQGGYGKEQERIEHSRSESKRDSSDWNHKKD